MSSCPGHQARHVQLPIGTGDELQNVDPWGAPRADRTSPSLRIENAFKNL